MTQPALYSSQAHYYYFSVFHGLRSMMKEEGWKALYKGLGPSLLGISHVAVQFPLYEQLKLLLSGRSTCVLFTSIDIYLYIIYTYTVR
jgi:solute carrier family 25 folate transporter 32